MALEHKINIQFVQEVEKYPCLYNNTLPEYVRKDPTDRVWADIGKKFGLSGFQCKEKWKNFRSVFVRHLKQSKTGSTLKNPYYLADYMQFAVPYIKFVKGTTGRCQETVNNEHVLPQSILPDESPLQAVTQSTDEFPSTPPSQSSPFENLPIEYVPTSNECSSNTETKKTKSKQTKVDQVVAAYFKMKKSKLVEDYNNEHTSNKMFLLSILPKMNRMNKKKLRVFKRRLLDLIDEIEDEDSDE